METVLPLVYVAIKATPQLLKLRANRAAASAVFLRAVEVTFMLAKVLMKVEVSAMSLMVAASIQNLVTVTGIKLLA